MSAIVLQLSDTHLRAEPGPGPDGRDPDERLATVLAAWSRMGERPDVVVLSGDNADDASAGGCRRLRQAVGALGAPVLAVPGNHDDATVVADVIGGPRVVETGAWRVVGIDTSRPGQVHGTVDVEALCATLDELDGRPTLLVQHHPPRSRSTNAVFQLDGADDLLAALGARPQVRILASGHLHDAFEMEGPGGLGLLGCPSTLVAIGHRGDEMEIGADAPTGGRVFRLADDGSWSAELLAA